MAETLGSFLIHFDPDILICFQLLIWFHCVCAVRVATEADAMQVKSFLHGLLAHLIIVPAWVIPPGDLAVLKGNKGKSFVRPQSGS